MKPLPLLLTVTICLGTHITPAAADANGNKVMALLDKAMTSAHDQYFVFDLVTKEPGKAVRKLSFEVTIQGTDKRFIRFLAPGDVKDMRILIQSLTKMYVYLPAYKKVRRVAGHVRDQGFMGSAYSYDEMAIVTYGNVYDADLISEDEKTWTLLGKRRPGKEGHIRYHKIKFVIRKSDFQVKELVYFNDKDVKLKTETRSNFECQGKHCNPRLMKIVDHTRNDIQSMLIRKKWKPNPGVPADFFSLRSLQRR